MSSVAVVCARFQPPCRAHVEAVRLAAACHARVLVVLVGADEACSLTNPWSLAARRALLMAALPGMRPDTCLALRDRRYERLRWSTEFAARVGEHLPPAASVRVIADPGSSAWIPPLPVQWPRQAPATPFGPAEQALRTGLLWRATAPDWSALAPLLAPGTDALLRESLATPPLAALREEAAYLTAYRETWAAAPYPPVFVTVDALVTWRDEVLLIERGRLPGRGLMALPGGFVDPSETLATACVREVREETGLELAAEVPAAARVFDDPERSLRGRTITHVFHFDLDPARARPAVAGADDARAARWLPQAGLGPAQFFEDHYAILQHMLGLP